jgi:hypothetical protein
MLITILCIIISITASSQGFGEIPKEKKNNSVETGKPLIFEKVIQVPELSKTDIYELARIWFTESFTNADNVLQIKDKEAGQLIGKGSFKYTKSGLTTTTSVNGNIEFLIKIFAKDGRYKYIITDFTHYGNNFTSYKNTHFGLLTDENICPRKVKGNPKNVCQKNWDKMKKESEIMAKVMAEKIKEYIKKENLEEEW